MEIMSVLSEPTAGQQLIALSIEAKDALLNFRLPQIERLEQRWQSLRDKKGNFALNRQDISVLARHCQELKTLLELTSLNMALLQRVTSKTSPSAFRSLVSRTYPWQH